ncbi:decarboxylating 6-phosphogluconate dehydrogenase [Dissulfurirhabdus thermomarina]|uniref:Decarboxylating 6-phosphogluconate dehydrogenase n=1 Tax=Dissulfurirhabdus thermomarina TaxID=1765737 RepID=A0A6N9TSH1_DISTH|nr:decarboxylating 6-phosphogluconate dehydrogenase [Dissulfurirhabdus thermomarina]NDY41496.1 decarboxylating 6-phosphogluconate dehydrogenase [Dissulfurirhabdus thermomarina]NMX23877.1 decarboxylating 6-phosphogluconate dehydrogenase [Dissulfurirhabdus thermomarina]
MQIGMIGLGRMGMNMARRLLRGGHEVAAYNRTAEKVRRIEAEGAAGADSPEALVRLLDPPRVVWLMLPVGPPVDEHIERLRPHLGPGDLVVDGGNSDFRDDLRRAEALGAEGIRYVDAGVSGGVWGLEKGYCLMLGGGADDYRRLGPVLDTLAPPGGHMHCGPVGAGHFVKMVHNGIEYALMEAYGEGFELLRASPYGPHLDFGALAALWNRGSVIRSWLLELLEDVFREDPGLEEVRGVVADSGEGRWTVREAVRLGVPADAMAHALFKRFASQREDLFSDRVVAALRRAFGGHEVRRAGGGGR